MLFDKLFKKNDSQKKASVSVSVEVREPSKKEIEQAFKERKEKENNIALTTNSPFNTLVLWWISKKKTGYEISTNKFPKWFITQYSIDFNGVVERFTKENLLHKENGIVTVSPSGFEYLKEHAYCVYIHEHPEYSLAISDFTSINQLSQRKLNDIVWGIFNKRTIEYTSSMMWKKLSDTYSNMAELLISEAKYSQAVDLVFASSYIQTSGMEDNNELKPIREEGWKTGKKRKLDNGMPDIEFLEINNYRVTVPFMKIQENLKMEWSTIKEMFASSRTILSLEQLLPFKYFEKEEAFELFRGAIEAGGTKGIFTLSDMKKKLKYNLPNEHSNKYFYASTENKVNQSLR